MVQLVHGVTPKWTNHRIFWYLEKLNYILNNLLITNCEETDLLIRIIHPQPIFIPNHVKSIHGDMYACQHEREEISWNGESKQTNDDATWHHQIGAINELSVHGISLCEHKPENWSFSPWLYETNQITAMKANQNTWIQLGKRLYYSLQKGKHNWRSVMGYELHTLAKELDIPTNHPNLCVLLSVRLHKGNTMSCFALIVAVSPNMNVIRGNIGRNDVKQQKQTLTYNLLPACVQLRIGRTLCPLSKPLSFWKCDVIDELRGWYWLNCGTLKL